MERRHRGAFTLIEILIVVAVMAILAAVILPQFIDSTNDARVNTALTNLQTLRSQIGAFKAQHGGTGPNATLTDLTVVTTYSGRQCGPYLATMPENPLNGSTAVKTSAGATIVTGDITPGTGGGWVYNPSQGEVRLDNVDYWQR